MTTLFIILGITRLLADAGDLEVCGAAPSGRQALSALRSSLADLAIVDISLNGANGLELTKNLKAEHPEMPVLVPRCMRNASMRRGRCARGRAVT